MCGKEEEEARAHRRPKMGCLLAKVVEVVSHIVAPCIAAFREGSKKVRALEARVETAEQKSLELEEKNRAAEIRIQVLLKELATAQAAIGVLAVTVMLSMIFPQTRVLIGLVGLSFVCGSQLLPTASNLGQYASKLLQQASKLARQIPPALDRLIVQVRSGMREWRWKSVLVRRTLGSLGCR
jgi:hypothetical protein